MKGKKGPLVVLEYWLRGGMNLERYQKQVLDTHLFDPHQQMSKEKGLVLFQQDGAPSKTTQKACLHGLHSTQLTFSHILPCHLISALLNLCGKHSRHILELTPSYKF